MRYAVRVCTALGAIVALCGCPESTHSGAALPTGASARPAVELVVRTVNIKKNMTTRAVDGKGDDDEWTAIDSKVYAIVTFDIAHNACKAGDKIETSKAVLVAGSEKIHPVGGGANLDKLCVQCQPSEPLDCNAASRLRPYTIIFEVDEKADVTKTTLTYRDREAPLAVAKLSDSRANDAVADEIELKKAELAQLRKKLENTSNLANGKVIQSEMDRIRKEIAAIEKKKK